MYAVGAAAISAEISLPFVPGIDLAGTVAELGDGVTGVKVGDTVVAMLPMDAAGAAAEYVLVSAEALAASPETVNLIDAAALPLSGLAAWQSLFELVELKHGQTVLINGAGGAVGGVAVQLAVDAGATMTAADAAWSSLQVQTPSAARSRSC